MEGRSVGLWMGLMGGPPSVLLQFSGCLETAVSAEGIPFMPFSGRMVSRYVPNSCLAATAVAQRQHTLGKGFIPKENTECPLWPFTSQWGCPHLASSLPLSEMLVSPGPWQAPLNPPLQCKPAPSQCSFSSLGLPGASIWEVSHSGAAQFPGSAFLVPETASCSSVSPSESCPKPGNCASETVNSELCHCLSVCLQWETAIIGTECFCSDRGDLSPLPWAFWHWDVQFLVSTERGTH